MRDTTQPRLLSGRYELDGIVGRGGMAEVFRARDNRLNRIVAVKTLRNDLARDQTFQARFRREAQSAASLNHPSIVSVYDTGEDIVDGTPLPYIVMEFVEGRTVRDLLRDDRRLRPERAAEITDALLEALDYSHRNGIVHRDIKPGNVMLTRSGDVKVMDFGIARSVSDTQLRLTQTAEVIGTAHYMSPEQARGERVGARSDLYSTGCVLYELLTGRPPFTGDSPLTIAYQHVKQDPVPPSRADPGVPAWADGLVLKALQKDQARRYQSAGEMRADIRRAMAGGPLTAPEPKTRSSVTPTAPRPKTRSSVTPTAPQPKTWSWGTPTAPKPKTWSWVTLAVVIAMLTAAILGIKLLTGSNNMVGVPSVTGMSLGHAENAITGAGLQTGRVSWTRSRSAAKNDVISTNPPSGTQVSKGRAVNLVVSTGPGPAASHSRSRHSQSASPTPTAQPSSVTSSPAPSPTPPSPSPTCIVNLLGICV